MPCLEIKTNSCRSLYSQIYFFSSFLHQHKTVNSILSMNEVTSNILIFLPPIPPLEYFAPCSHLWKEYTALLHPTQMKYILWSWKERGNRVTL